MLKVFREVENAWTGMPNAEIEREVLINSMESRIPEASYEEIAKFVTKKLNERDAEFKDYRPAWSFINA